MIDLSQLAIQEWYVELEEKFRNEIRNRICEKFGSLRQFGLKTGLVGGSHLGVLLRQLKCTKLNLWLDICVQLDIEPSALRRAIEKIRSRNPDGQYLTIDRLPILPSVEIASLIGHAMGDGSINATSGWFVYTNKNTELQDSVSGAIDNIFGIECQARGLSGAGVPERYYPRLVGDVLFLAGAPRGNKITKPFSIPRWIVDGSKEVKRAFLRALFDDEATVKIKSHELLFKLSKNIKYLSSLQSFMECIKALLEELGIEVTSIKRGNVLEGKNGLTVQLVLGIHGYENFVKFSKSIAFHHPQKQYAIQKMVEGYVSFPLRSGRGQRLVYKGLLQPKTIYILARELNMSNMAVYKHLKKLEAAGQAEQIKPSSNEAAVWRRVN